MSLFEREKKMNKWKDTYSYWMQEYKMFKKNRSLLKYFKTLNYFVKVASEAVSVRGAIWCQADSSHFQSSHSTILSPNILTMLSPNISTILSPNIDDEEEEGCSTKYWQILTRILWDFDILTLLGVRNNGKIMLNIFSWPYDLSFMIS